MAGELWRQYWQIGEESSAGTGVAATRRMYFGADSRLSREREARPHRFTTASRDNVRAFTLGPTQVGGTLQMPLSASEIVELLLMTIKGGVTPTGASTPKLWTFTPGTSLDPVTIEWYDGARAWEANGCYGDTLRISGSANGAATVELDVFGMSLETTTMTASLGTGTPDIIEGWETALYIDAFEGTAESTQISAALLNWEIEITNGLARKYFADNSEDAGAITISELGVSANLTLEASAAQAATEFANWDAATKRLVRLVFGNNEVIESTDKKWVKVDLPGAWDAFDLGGTDENTRTYELSLQYVYDPTNEYGVQILAQNARGTAYDDRT